MIQRVLIMVLITAGLASPTLTAADSAPPNNVVAATQAPGARAQATPKPKAKSRRVIIFGTTIVGDVLKLPIDKTVPWQRPAAFQSDGAPLAHDFMTELLTPLDRNAILRDGGDHEQ